ncbi:ArnT family glycosyltransferase [Runella sp.]|uniref:ArnT family glycosyltransferase n=1 Tax=Runella sp. TaxID=1960881 RepID=UPI003D10F8D9
MIHFAKSHRADWIFYGLMACLIIGRWLIISDGEYDEDESTWIASALTVLQSSQKWWTLFNYSDSRPLTVLPLVIVHFFGFEQSYLVAKLVGVLFWAGSLLFLFKTFCLYTKPRKALWYIFPLVIYLSTTWNPAFVSYNSEHVCIFLLTIGLWLYCKFEKTGRSTWWEVFILGFVLGLLPFAKFQAIPLGLVTAGFALELLIFQKQRLTIALLIAGGIFPTLLVNIFYYSHHDINSFWQDYFWNIFFYSYTTTFSKLPLAERFNLGRVLHFVFYSKHVVLYFIGQFTLVVGGLMSLFMVSQKNRIVPFRLVCFSFLYLLSAIYAVLQSGNFFVHYLLFLIIPLLFLVFVVVECISTNPVFGLRWLALFAIFQSVGNLVSFESIPHRRPETEITSVLKKYHEQGNKLVLWGWADRFFISTGMPQGIRTAHTFNAYLPGPHQPYRLQQVVTDMEKNKPSLFVDIAVKHLSSQCDTTYRHYYFPILKRYISQHYQLVKIVDSVMIYRRREPAASIVVL